MIHRVHQLAASVAVLALVAGVLCGSSAAAQTPPAANRARLSGTVTSVNADAKQLSLKSDKGEAVSVTTTDRTRILRIPEGETDPNKGSQIELSALAAGDRLGQLGEHRLDGRRERQLHPPTIARARGERRDGGAIHRDFADPDQRLRDDGNGRGGIDRNDCDDGRRGDRQ